MSAKFRLEVVCLGGLVYSDDVDVLVAPGTEGELAVLAHHAPLMSVLGPGELKVKKGGEEALMAITGGFLEVRPDKVVILADACERAEDIDMDRAAAARKRAEALLKQGGPGVDMARAEAALRRSIARLRVAEVARRRGALRRGPSSEP
ncbi:MAG: F0F1 ATP synthase subunit epsilon [Chloroflexi bacterium]|nr:F0F1 ATP synthase subunit epsilon [Chloroflexota bacterium]